MKTTIILNEYDTARFAGFAHRFPLAPTHRLARACFRRGLRQLAEAPDEAVLAEAQEPDEVGYDASGRPVISSEEAQG